MAIASSAEQRLMDANEAFYRCFRDADLDGMRRLWSKQHMVACMHPGWPALHGYARVMASFEAIMRSGAPTVTAGDLQVVLLGDAAFITCIESVDDSQLAATNIFAREERRWAMVHHQAAGFRRHDLSELFVPAGGLN